MALNNSHLQFTGSQVQDAVKKYEQLGIYMNKFEITINPSAVFEMYHKVISKIIPHIEELLQSPKLQHLKYIFLVGGFAESDFLKKAMTEAFFKYKVLIPKHAITAVLRGAVLFGLNPDRIASRVARQTIGCELLKPFMEGVHDPQKKKPDENGKMYCKNVFEKYVTEEEEVELGDFKSFMSFPFSSKATIIVQNFYAVTDSKQHTYVDEKGMKKLAELEIPMLNTIGGKDREIETKVFFGGTEIKVESRDKRKGGKIVKTTLNFMCEKKQ